VRESFATRVQALRESWAERRQVARYSGSHDFDSQLQLLLTLHEWCSEAVAEVQSVYGDTLDIDLSARPNASEQPPGFTLLVGGSYAITFTLVERKRLAGSRWHVSVAVRSPGSGTVTHAGPERRNGQWTRTRLEDVLLSVLGAYERSLSSGIDDDGDGPEAGTPVTRINRGPGSSLAG
jgi:hypothetical protein